jgi:hypothetical protein
MEIHAIPSVTVSNQQFLTGDRYGKPVILGVASYGCPEEPQRPSRP